ncbi:MAG TPA: cation transporter [Euryarchaeota archaeon]|nr:cation transporter [Euryarchaeota archaeon]
MNKAERTMMLALTCNSSLFLSKLVIGIMTNSLAIVSDALHSLSDVFTDLLGLMGVRISERPEDEDHHYGHYKYEAIVSFTIGILILLSSTYIFKEGVERVLHGAVIEIRASSFLVVGIGSVVAYLLSKYEENVGKEVESLTLIAESKHALSDSISSFSVLICLFLISRGFWFLDVLVSLGIFLFLVRLGVKMVWKSSEILSDKSWIDPSVILEEVGKVEGVLDVHDVKSRWDGKNRYIEMHLVLRGDLSLEKAHEIADEVERIVERKFNAKATIHMEPGGEGKGE